MIVNLEEAADVDFVMRVHEHHVLEQPEERPGIFLFGLQQVQDAVVLEKQPASALCRREDGITARSSELNCSKRENQSVFTYVL